MVDSAKLEVDEREIKGSAGCRRLRKSGRVPMNLYGLDRPPRALTADAHQLGLILDKGVHIIELTRGSDTQVVLVKDVQYDALGSKLVHADLLRIDKEKVVQVFVPVRYIGSAPSVSGSVVDKLIEDVHVECLPLEIPREFLINLGTLKIGDTITISDLEMPGTCKPYGHNDNDPVVMNHMKIVREAEEEEGEAGEESVEPEVIGKGGGDDEPAQED